MFILSSVSHAAVQLMVLIRFSFVISMHSHLLLWLAAPQWFLIRLVNMKNIMTTLEGLMLERDCVSGWAVFASIRSFLRTSA